MDKEKRKDIKRAIRRAFRKENLIKVIIIFAGLALILTSILPYLL